MSIDEYHMKGGDMWMTAAVAPSMVVSLDQDRDRLQRVYGALKADPRVHGFSIDN